MFIPIGDNNSRVQAFPFFVILIILANAFVWYLQLTLGDRFTYGFSAIPFEITHQKDLIHAQIVQISGQRIPIPQAPGPHPIYLSILTSMFMHGSWMHIIGNMLYLWIFGDQIEDRLGHFKFLIFYILCGVAAAFAQIFPQPNSMIPCLGASGAIAGVLGAYAILHPTNRVRVLMFRNIIEVPAFIVLGGWIVLQVLSQVSLQKQGASDGVAYGAHIGGFIAGIVLLAFLGTKSRGWK